MRHARASVLVAPLVILALLGSSLVGRDRLGFRDVSHFYTPLYDYIAERQSVDWLPLWNPLDQTGVPLAGETTTAVFYPVRVLVYSLPFSADVAMTWYVALHLTLASLTAWVVARWSGVSEIGSAIGAVSYAISGSVLFLYTNPPFLVGAAWLPLVLGCFICAGGPKGPTRVVIASAGLALMVLGGDPQTALHGMMIVAVVWAARTAVGKPSPLRFRAMVLVSFTAGILAMPQIAASLDWSRQSDRVNSDEEAESWFSPPIVGSRRHQAFEYSLPPWHLIELVTPNAFGQLFPLNQRLSQWIPGDGRMWTPSIYMGMIVGIVSLARLWRLRSDGMDLWVGVALLSISLAMGHFGVVWWLQASTGVLDSIDSAVGGPYWFAYQFVPGYASFRYPAKWLSVFAFAAAMTTASFVDQEICRQRLRRIMLPALFTLAIATIATWLVSSVYSLIHDDPLSSSVQDEFWGPLQTKAALSSTTISLLHACLVTAILAWLYSQKRTSHWPAQKLLWATLIVVALDTAIAARGMILTVPRMTERQLIGDYESMAASNSDRWMRTVSDGGWPRVWAETSSVDRAIEVEASGRLAWFGRWHLADRQAVLNNMVSIRSHNIGVYWIAAQSIAKEMEPDAQREFWQAMRNWLGVGGVIHTTDRTRDLSLDHQRYRLVDRRTRVQGRDDLIQAHGKWDVARDWVSDRSMMERRLHEIAAADGYPIPLVNLRSTSPELHASNTSLPLSEAAHLKPTQQNDDNGNFEVELASPALLTRRVFQDGNWSAAFRREGSKEWIQTDVHRVDFLLQGVVLPAGKHQLQFTYHPWWLPASLAISLFGWIGVVAYLPIQNRLKTRSRMSSV